MASSSGDLFSCQSNIFMTLVKILKGYSKLCLPCSFLEKRSLHFPRRTPWSGRDDVFLALEICFYFILF